MKKLDFGHGQAHEFTWFYTPEIRNKPTGPSTIMEHLTRLEVKASKVVDRWDRAFMLDSKRISGVDSFREGTCLSVGCGEAAVFKRRTQIR